MAQPAIATTAPPQTQAPEPFPPELGQTVSAISFAAALIGLFCLYDAVREGLGAFQYHAAIPMLAVYKGVLGIYATARQAHQWNDPDVQASITGRFFVLA